MIKISATTDAPLLKLSFRKVEGYRRGMGKAIKSGISITNRAAEEWKTIFFPRNLGNLIGASGVTIFFRASLRVITMRFVSGNRKNVRYASFVNKMTGVNWTRAGTREHYFDEWQKFVKKVLRAAIRVEVGRFFAENALRVPIRRAGS